MGETNSYQEFTGEVADALLDAELFLKYRATEKAVGRLQRAVTSNPRAIPLHEKLRELMVWQKRPVEAARHCLVLATLYIERERYEEARDRLLEAKQLDARISVAPGLEAIRRARTPHQAVSPSSPVAFTAETPRSGLLSGQIGSISIFDIIQIIENGRLTGGLYLAEGLLAGRVFFNDGNIVGAETPGEKGEKAFSQLLQITQGVFDFTLALEPFPVTIEALTNTNLLLETLRRIDEKQVPPVSSEL